MNLIDTLNQIWTQILEVTSVFVMPDWGFLIGLLPVLIVVGLVGPFLTGLVLGTMIYLMRKPRVKVDFVEGPRVAEIGAGWRPDLPGRAAPLPAPRARSTRRAWSAATLTTSSDGRLPDVRPRPLGAGRHLHQLRPRPQGQAARGRVRKTDRPKPGGAAAA